MGLSLHVLDTKVHFFSHADVRGGLGDLSWVRARSARALSTGFANSIFYFLFLDKKFPEFAADVLDFGWLRPKPLLWWWFFIFLDWFWWFLWFVFLKLLYDFIHFLNFFAMITLRWLWFETLCLPSNQFSHLLVTFFKFLKQLPIFRLNLAQIRILCCIQKFLPFNLHCYFVINHCFFKILNMLLLAAQIVMSNSK